MLKHNELKKGVLFILSGQPHQVVESSLMYKGRGSSVMQTKLKNLITGNTVAKTFHQGDEFEETDTSFISLTFVYVNKDKYVFSHKDEKSNRLELTKEQVGNGAQFLTQNQEVKGVLFNEKIIGIDIPVKVQLKVTEAPPAVRGNRAEAGTKQVTLKSGAIINTPLFVESGDLVEVNTTNAEYVRRVE